MFFCLGWLILLVQYHYFLKGGLNWSIWLEGQHFRKRWRDVVGVGSDMLQFVDAVVVHLLWYFYVAVVIQLICFGLVCVFVTGHTCCVDLFWLLGEFRRRSFLLWIQRRSFLICSTCLGWGSINALGIRSTTSDICSILQIQWFINYDWRGLWML